MTKSTNLVYGVIVPGQHISIGNFVRAVKPRGICQTQSEFEELLKNPQTKVLYNGAVFRLESGVEVVVGHHEKEVENKVRFALQANH